MAAILDRLDPGMPILFGGNRVVRVSDALAAAFAPGDRLIVVQESGDLLHVPAATHTLASVAVTRARQAFGAVSAAPAKAIGAFFEAFAARLADAAIWRAIEEANQADVAAARSRGASVTRLIASPKMRAEMVAGLRGWREAPDGRGRPVEQVAHEGWSVRLETAPLGVVGFVFEGRPNVLADAAGVIAGGNTVVFRIGSDALGTAQAMMARAFVPALQAAGLPTDAAVLLESPERAAGWALFSDPRLSLAVARGSGPAVAQLGAVARQAGIPVSLHGTGGAWILAHESADPAWLEACVAASLDRKVCNTLNVCCLPRAAAERLVPAFLAGLAAAGAARGAAVKLHATPDALEALPPAWREGRGRVVRADGAREEPTVEAIAPEDLGREWEWEESPEVSLALVEDLDAAIALFNRHSPRFVASVLAADPEVRERAFAALDAPFVGDGFTRWVDGQYALRRPELGLSNWQGGRLFARGAILSGDGVFTVRARMRQESPELRR